MDKKLINAAADCVAEAIEGVLLSDSRLMRVEGLNILVRSDVKTSMQSTVSIISGGGSGHEPAHAGYIGEGMLTAAVLGNVFASPSVSSILAAIRVTAGAKGVLLVVKNYTGDRLNFGMASEIAKQEGIDVKMVIVADDCALPLGKGITGGRGLAGTIFVHKVAGAYAARGLSLEEVHRAASAAAESIGTLGVALSTCTVPGTPVSTRLAQPGLIEVGMGIHGEPGREQMHLPATGAADKVAQLLVAGILDQGTSKAASDEAGPAEVLKRLPYSTGQRVVVLLNNLGTLPVIEMQIVTRGVMQELLRRDLVPVRAYVGPFVTSLEMCGVSLSLIVLPDSDDELLNALDAHTTAPAWVKSSNLDSASSDLPRNRVLPYSPAQGPSSNADCASLGLRADRDLVLKVTRLVCEKIIVLEPQLTSYDSICGDGDCGVVMKRGAQHVIAAFADAYTGDTTVDLMAFFNRLADTLSASMGGTSGVLLELCFRAMASSFKDLRGLRDANNYGDNATAADWTVALSAGVKAIGFYGGASEGMRTMLDALIPAVTTLESGGDMKDAAAAAMQGMARTAQMQSQAGRSNYVAADRMRGTPDPGAFAVAAAFAVMADQARF